ncbi:uncharacterized protein LOC125515962 [Triticum urartu]|uniref:uncharacterized protein LOC125515962 n=1 Tax=Triticum urartu TaxID=4572 RepID=UPI0020448746|nr:uncharacterized protein LOC125515962 [Triticum urartu]
MEEALIPDDRTWYRFLPILAWIVADAEEARHTLEHAADELERAAAEANRIADLAHGGSDRAVLVLLRRDVHRVLNLERDRVADLRREAPDLAAAAEPGPPYRPNSGLLVNVGHGLELLLGTEPSEDAIHSFSLRWEDNRHVWYPEWLVGVRREVRHALRRLNRARAELEHVSLAVADFLAVATSPEGAATAVEACEATADGYATAAQHARRAVANLDNVLNILQGLRDDILDDPPPGRVRYFFGYVDNAAGDDAAAGD